MNGLPTLTEMAEMALGRLPVRTAVEASRIIDKLVDYEIAPRNRNILLVSDLCDAIIGSKTLSNKAMFD